MASSTSALLSKLITAKEDFFYLHKVLGIACLISFLSRFMQWGDADMGFIGGRRYRMETPLTVALHLALSLSSLQFKIPPRRIGKSGFRIWPEYRIHSIVFAARSLACILVNFVFQNYGHLQTTHDVPQHLAYTMIVLCSCAAADWGSYSVPETHRSHTIRDLNATPTVRFHFSVMQFYATTGCLFGFTRSSIHFVMVFIIQCNAFLMTLQRKNLASHMTMVAAYGVMLSIGFVVGAWEVHRVGAFFFLSTLSNTAAILRMGFQWNKYVLWTFMSVLLYLTRPTMESPLSSSSSSSLSMWPFLYLASMGAMSYLAYTKIAVPPKIENMERKQS